MTGYSSRSVKCTELAKEHNNGEQTRVLAVDGDPSVIVAVDFAEDGTPLKAEPVGSASTLSKAEDGASFWADNNPKGLGYGLVENLKHNLPFDL